MTKFSILYVEVLHGAPRHPVCSVDKKNPEHDFIILAHKVTEFQALMTQGIDHDRIIFTVEERATP